MRVFRLVFFLIFSSLCVGQIQEEHGINIVPLRSERVDVEKFATKIEKRFSTNSAEHVLYTMPDGGTIEVEYAKKACIWHGWNVRTDTVISYLVYPVTKTSFDSQNKKYLKQVDDTLRTYYSDVSNGLQYRVDQVGNVEYEKHTPKADNFGLRCRGFPPYSPTADADFEYMGGSFQIKSIPAWDIGLLAGFLRDIQDSNTRVGRVFLYFKKGQERQISVLKKRIEGYAFMNFKLSKARLKIELGGYRDQAEIVSYLLQDSSYPLPLAKPKYSN